MAEKILQTRLQLKYDDISNWETQNPILKAGEVAFATIGEIEKDSEGRPVLPPVMFKVGDGNAEFKSLDWVAAKAADVYGWAKSKNLDRTEMPTGLKDALETIEAAIAGKANEVHTHEASDITDFATEVNKLISKSGLASNSAVEGLLSRMTTAEGEIRGLNTSVSGINDTLATKASQADLTALSDTVTGHTTTLDTLVAGEGVKDSVDYKVKQAKDAAQVADNKAVEAATAAAAANTAAEAAQKAADDAQEHSEGVAEDLAQEVIDRAAADTALGERINGHDTAISEINGKFADYATSTQLSGVNTSLTNQIKLKADADKVYSKTEADGKFATLTAHQQLESTVSGHTASISAIEKDIEDNIATKQELTDATNSLTEAIGGKVSQSDYNAKVEEINAQISGLDETVLDHEGRISGLEGTITGLSGAMHFKGVVTSDPTNITTGYENGDVVIYGEKEFVWTTNGDKAGFVEFGDATGNANLISELSDEIDTIKSTKADKTALTDAEDRITDIENDYATGTELTTKANELTAEINKKADSETVEGLQTEVSGIKGNYAKVVDTGKVDSDGNKVYEMQAGADVLVFYCGTASDVW